MGLEELLLGACVQGREVGWGTVVECVDGGADAHAVFEDFGHCVCDGEVCVGAAAEEGFVAFAEPDDGVVAELELEDAEAEVVPVDDELEAAEARDEVGDEEGGDCGGVLEEDVGCGGGDDVEEEVEEGGELEEGFEGGEEDEAEGGGGVEEPGRRREGVDCDVLVLQELWAGEGVWRCQHICLGGGGGGERGHHHSPPDPQARPSGLSTGNGTASWDSGQYRPGPAPPRGPSRPSPGRVARADTSA